jgi:hypothetical protein
MSEFNYDSHKSGITPEEMWTAINPESNPNWGIAGYESPKIYFDHRKEKKDREIFEMHTEVWSKRAHYPKGKENLDKDGKVILPQKTNFIDDCIKQSKSCFSKEKFDNFVNNLRDKKGKTLEEIEGIKVAEPPINKDPKKAKLYRQERSTYIADIFSNELKKSNHPPNIQELIDKTKERHSKYTTQSPDLKEKYKGKTSLPKADIISFMSDAQWMGERMPFYNTKPEEGEGSKEKNKKLFFPEKIKIMNRSPAWKFNKPVINREYLDKREEQINEKVNNMKKSWEDRKIQFIDNVSISYFKTQSGVLGGHRYHKVF